jgi:hypothetical protein
VSWNYSLSEDGKLLAVVTSEDTRHIKILSPETLQEIHSFLSPPRLDVMPLSADDKSLFYITLIGSWPFENSTIWRQPLDASTPVRLASLPGKSVESMSPSPDGKKLGLTTQSWHSEAVLIRDSR